MTDARAGMRVPASATTTHEYLSRVVAMRHYAVEAARGEAEATHANTVLGRSWLVIEPMMMIGVYFVLFGLGFRAGRQIDNFLLFLAVGRLAYSHHRRGVMQASSRYGQAKAVAQIGIPKAVVPMAGTLAAMVASCYAIVAMFPIAWSTGQSPRWAWALVPVLVVAQALLNLGIGLCLFSAIERVPDLRNILQTLLLIGFYASGVVLPIEPLIADSPHVNWLMALLFCNPFYGYIKAYQWVIMGYDLGEPFLALVSSVVWTAVLLGVGLQIFVRAERRAWINGRINR